MINKTIKTTVTVMNGTTRLSLPRSIATMYNITDKNTVFIEIKEVQQ